jgi:flagellar protein FliT
MPRQLELYEEMGRISSVMVDAARAGDWERLIELESGVARLRDTLTAMPADTAGSVAELDRRRRLIERILDDDAEIRRHTEPWMEHVRHLLGDNRRLRELQRAYAVATTAPGGGT